jgi:5-formyltetrahydrofolate cyclo-ligase
MLEEEKRMLREKIWKLMEENKIARFPLPCYGRIPNFEGSDKAAERVKQLDEWKNAKTVMANPDFAQQKVREFALKDRKTLIMASPRLKHGYLLINPEKVRGKEDFASTIEGAFRYGIRLKELVKPDLIITGCVAVDKTGYRLGKGGGYGDREIEAFQQKFGKILIITTVHDIQIVDKVPVGKYDTKVDIIVTPTKLIQVPA